MKWADTARYAKPVVSGSPTGILSNNTATHTVDAGQMLKQMLIADTTLANLELRVMVWAEQNGLYVGRLEDELIIGVDKSDP